jgi:hypothetical protein
MKIIRWMTDCLRSVANHYSPLFGNPPISDLDLDDLDGNSKFFCDGIVAFRLFHGEAVSGTLDLGEPVPVRPRYENKEVRWLHGIGCANSLQNLSLTLRKQGRKASDLPCMVLIHVLPNERVCPLPVKQVNRREPLNEMIPRLGHSQTEIVLIEKFGVLLKPLASQGAGPKLTYSSCAIDRGVKQFHWL